MRPVEDVTRSVEDVTRPVEDVTRPVEDVTRPVEDVTRPIEVMMHPSDPSGGARRDYACQYRPAPPEGSIHTRRVAGSKPSQSPRGSLRCH